MLEVKSLSAGYLDKHVLEHVDFRIPSEKVTVILGPNGCGKSTLLKALCGIIPADSGQVVLDGENILTLPQRQLAQRVAYLAQSRQVPDITVERLVLHGRFPYLGYPRRYRKEDYAIADAAMKTMGVAELADELVQNLSGGQRQKVYIAMALVQDTPVILLDEPTTYLDISHQLEIMELVARLNREENITILMVLHDINHAARYSDELIVLKDHQIYRQGNPWDILQSDVLEKVFHVEAQISSDSENGTPIFYAKAVI